MKIFLILTIMLGCTNIAIASVSNEEDLLLAKFSEATKSKNLAKKCGATKDLLSFYIKNGDKTKAEMAKGILKRDCKKFK